MISRGIVEIFLMQIDIIYYINVYAPIELQILALLTSQKHWTYLRFTQRKINIQLLNCCIHFTEIPTSIIFYTNLRNVPTYFYLSFCACRIQNSRQLHIWIDSKCTNFSVSFTFNSVSSQLQIKEVEQTCLLQSNKLRTVNKDMKHFFQACRVKLH